MLVWSILEAVVCCLVVSVGTGEIPPGNLAIGVGGNGGLLARISRTTCAEYLLQNDNDFTSVSALEPINVDARSVLDFADPDD